MKGCEVGNEHHRPAARCPGIDRTLALKQIVVELGKSKEVQGRPIERSVAVVAGILLVNNAIEFSSDWTVVCLVHLCLPEKHTGAIAVAANHLPRVLINALLEHFIPHKLPAWVGNDGQNAEFIARVHERGILRIAQRAGGEAGIPELLCVAIMDGRGKSVADVGMILVAVGAEGKELLPLIESPASLSIWNVRIPIRVLIVHGLAMLENERARAIQVWVIRMPEQRPGHRHLGIIAIVETHSQYVPIANWA
jgi:hypothetical protein